MVSFWCSGRNCRGFLFGVLGGILGVMGVVLKTVYRPEQLIWSWKDAFQIEDRDWTIAFVGGISGGISALLVGWWVNGAFGLCMGELFSLCIVRFCYGWNINILQDKMVPMQNLYSTLWASILCLIGFILVVITGMSLSIVLIAVEQRGLGIGIIFGVIAGIIGGLFRPHIGGLGGGISTLIKHYALRYIFSRANMLPFRTVTFLEAMSERLLLERDGALYRFRHLLLRDFIADLSDKEIDELVRGL
ncbi:MAG TPA: hypothetical protein VFS21_00055 [Roseiflexaceae bacterium]|nr:hypothetical protein [Roseiflexaceae bacterium]